MKNKHQCSGVVESIRLVNIFYKKRVSYFLAAFCLLFGILLCKLGMNYSRELPQFSDVPTSLSPFGLAPC